MSVCAIYIVPESIVITQPSSPTATDGAITLSAFDPNSDLNVVYSIGNAPTFGGRPRFSSVNGGSITFEDLGVGTYRIFAGNSESCIRNLLVTVPFDKNFGVRHRLEFKDIAKQNEYRFDIEEINYTGSINNEIGGDKPIVINWRGEGNENPFVEVIPSELNITMISEQDSQFIHLYTSNESRFRGNLYKNNGTYDLIWSGFLIPMLFQEEYVVKERYPVSFTFTDGLSDLSEIDFSDDSGQIPQGRISILTAIRYCLNKTNLRLNIKESVSFVHEDLDDEESILTQVYIDPRVYEGQNCYFTLTNLLKIFKSRISQSNGIWYIDYVSLKSKSQVTYREFDYEGNYIGEETLEPRVLLRREDSVSPKMFFKDRSAFFKVLQTYGSINLDLQLNLKDRYNILKFGDFNADDVVNGQIKGWSITEDGVFTNADGTKALSYGIDPNVDNSAFFTNFNYSTFARNVIPSINQKITLTSDYVDIVNTGFESLLKFSFDVETFATIKEAFIYLDFTVEAKLTSSTLTTVEKSLIPIELASDGDGFSILNYKSSNNESVRIYITGESNFNADIVIDAQTFKIFLDERDSAEFRVIFTIYSNETYDYDIDDVEDIITFNSFARIKDQIRAVDGNVDSAPLGKIRTYKLIPGELTTTDPPEKIKPLDYNSEDPLYWNLERTDTRPFILRPVTDSRTGEVSYSQAIVGQWLTYILIDNVVLGYYPNKVQPLSVSNNQLVIDAQVKSVYQDTLLHGDIEVADIDKNYKHISFGWLSDVNGNLLDPTWAIDDGVVASYDTLQNLNISAIYNQIYIPRILLTGDVDIREVDFSMFNSIYEVRSGRIFLPGAITLDFFENTANVSIIEILKGEAIIDENDPDLPGEGGVDPIEPPVRIREHTEEFSNEFS